jgi:DNA-binding HxlR family transcriptional regulator
MVTEKEIHNKQQCTMALKAVRDALDALNGKWKLQIIIALKGGPLRFKELQRTVEGVTAKVLTKELRELELNDLVKRHVYDSIPVTVEYELTPHSNTLDAVMKALTHWGLQHREHIMGSCTRAGKRQKQVTVA